MPRIRAVKPELFLSESLSRVSVEAERTFVGLWTQADDRGRLKDQPAVINGALWPLRPEHGIDNMQEDLKALIKIGVLCRYEAESRSYLHIVGWAEHQRINRPTESSLPPCPKHDAPVKGTRSAVASRTKKKDTTDDDQEDDMGVYDNKVDAFEDLRATGAVKKGRKKIGVHGIDPKFKDEAEKIAEHFKTARAHLGTPVRVTDTWWTNIVSLLRGGDSRPAFTADQVCDIISFAAQDRFWHSHITDPKALIRHGVKLFGSDDFVQWSLDNNRPASSRPRNNLIGKRRGTIAADKKAPPGGYREEL